jgi:lipid-A-disaccharide synthase
MNNNNNNILILAGETSGDMHGSALVSAMLKDNSKLQFYGIAGDNMIAEGVNPLFHIKDMAFLGFVEVIKHLPFIFKVEKTILDFVKLNKIKLAVLIDYPGFNLRIAKKLKALGTKIVYYISPQIWAWHQNRIKKIKARVDKMLVVFPFEKKFYEHGQVPVEYVGHPLVERIDKFNFITKEELFAKLNIDKEILLILPGSRKHEIEQLLPKLTAAATIVGEKNNLQIVVACADNFKTDYLEQFIKSDKIKVVKGSTYNLLKHSKFGIIKSGTSTLEAAIIGLPFVAVYSTSKFTYTIGKRLIKIDHIAMPNIVAGKTVVKEFIQDDVNEKIISEYIISFLNDNKALDNLKAELNKIKNKLGGNGASVNAAKIIETMLNEV